MSSSMYTFSIVAMMPVANSALPVDVTAAPIDLMVLRPTILSHKRALKLGIVIACQRSWHFQISLFLVRRKFLWLSRSGHEAEAGFNLLDDFNHRPRFIFPFFHSSQLSLRHAVLLRYLLVVRCLCTQEIKIELSSSDARPSALMSPPMWTWPTMNLSGQPKHSLLQHPLSSQSHSIVSCLSRSNDC